MGLHWAFILMSPDAKHNWKVLVLGLAKSMNCLQLKILQFFYIVEPQPNLLDACCLIQLIKTQHTKERGSGSPDFGWCWFQPLVLGWISGDWLRTWFYDHPSYVPNSTSTCFSLNPEDKVLPDSWGQAARTQGHGSYSNQPKTLHLYFTFFYVYIFN